MVGRRVRTIAWGLGLLLAGCGGRSTDVRLANEGAAGAKGVGDTGPIASGGIEEPGPLGSSDGDTSSSGAGGQQDSASSASGATNTAGASSGGESPITGGAGAPDGEGPCTGEACGLAANPAPLWVTRLKGYGRGPAWIRFSGTDELVHIGAGQIDVVNTALDRSTGQVVGVPEEDRAFVATDASGRWIVRQAEQDCVVFDEETTAFRFQCGSDSMIRFSPDGSALADHSCQSEQDQLIKLDVYDTVSGERIATTTANLPCLYGDHDWNTLVDSKHRRTLFAHPQRTDLYVFDWASQTVTPRSIHQPSPPSLQPLNREGTNLGLSLSHDGQRLVSVGAADGLAWLDPKSLDVEFRIADVPFFNLYDNCFCTYLAESPVGWSPADEIYATAHRSGGIQLRSVSTQKTLAVLDPPSDPEVLKRANSSGFGPVLIEFAPNMRHLVALYPHYAVGYALSP